MTLLGRLELVSFPLPEIALALSPNGRAHHMARYRAVKQVQQRVWAEARMQSLPKMHGLVIIRPTWTFPITRRRDGDNLTAILKSTIDSLVKGGWLQDDSSEYVRLEPPVVHVERGRRSLLLEFEQAESIRPVLPIAQEAVDLGLGHAEPGFPPADQDGLELAAPDPAAHGFGVDAQAIRNVLDGQHAFGGHDHA